MELGKMNLIGHQARIREKQMFLGFRGNPFLMS